MGIEIGGLPLYDARLKPRAISMENPTGQPGAGGLADEGRKGAPCLAPFAKDQVFTMADIAGRKGKLELTSILLDLRAAVKAREEEIEAAETEAARLS